MESILKDILALPKQQQLSIMQALLQSWSKEEDGDSTLEAQLDLAEDVQAQIKSGMVNTLSLSEFKDRVRQNRN